MSGIHQRRMWTLPLPNADINYYDRMHIAIGRAVGKQVITDYDTLCKVLLQYILEQDTFIKALTEVKVDHDTLVSVSVSFNYQVNHDTLIKILTLVDIHHDSLTKVSRSEPIVPKQVIGAGSGISSAPITILKHELKKKKYPVKKPDEIVNVGKLDVSSFIKSIDKLINVRVDMVLEAKLEIGQIQLIESDIFHKVEIVDVNVVEDENLPIVISITKEDLQ